MKLLCSLFFLTLFTFSCSQPFARKAFDAEKQKKILEFQAEIKSNPKDDLMLQTLGTLYLSNNYIDEAKDYLERAVEMNPNNFEALAWLGVCKAKKGRELSGWYCFGINKINAVKNGVADLNTAVQKAPGNPVIRLARIGTLIGLKGRFSNFETAQEDLSFLQNNLKKEGFYPDEIKLTIDFYSAYYQLIKMEIEKTENPEKKEESMASMKSALDKMPPSSIKEICLDIFQNLSLKN